jgi:hypothetical protein
MRLEHTKPQSRVGAATHVRLKKWSDKVARETAARDKSAKHAAKPTVAKARDRLRKLFSSIQ